jgi:hypothetical protein
MNYLEMANQISKSKWKKEYDNCMKFEKQFVVNTIIKTMKN